jgi:hypothetical protein
MSLEAVMAIQDLIHSWMNLVASMAIQDNQY